MFFAIFFGIVFAGLFLVTLPFTLPLLGLGAVKVLGTVTEKMGIIEKMRLEAEKIRLKNDAGGNPFLWSWRKTLLFSFVILAGLSTLLILEKGINWIAS